MLNKLRANLAKKKTKCIGRGIGSGKGKTCGRGGKGQTARSGVALAGFEGGQMPLYRRLPKRGFKPFNKKTYQIINISIINTYIKNKKITNDIKLKDLEACGLYNPNKGPIKLLGESDSEVAFKIEVHAVSGSLDKKLKDSNILVKKI